MPREILAAVAWLHDGGVDPDGQVPKSRKHTAGVARRVRRMRRRRRQRLIRLRDYLLSVGIAPPPADEPQTLDPWLDRARLAEERIHDEQERSIRLGRAIMHMGRFRGWRNPWLNSARLKEIESPSNSLQNMRELAMRRFGVDESAVKTVGAIGALAARFPGVRIRPRTTVEAAPTVEQAMENGWLLFERIRQEDIAAELDLICRTQGVGEDIATKIHDLVFAQVKPYVKAESVGRDPFDKNEPRASRATLEFQEFRIRDKVANLRLQTPEGRIALPAADKERMVQYLLTYDKEARPTWLEVAEQIGLPAESLVLDGSGDATTTKAPIDDSSRLIRSSRKLPETRKWWSSADPETRADLIAFLSDPVEGGSPSDAVEELFEELSEEEAAELEHLSFTAGRSAYGRHSLRLLNQEMRNANCDLFDARQRVFQVDRDWAPPRATFAEQVGQPTVDRNIALVRRFLMTATDKWGVPERVIIEHTRDAFMTPEKAQKLQREQLRRQRARGLIRDELRAEGIAEPSDRDIRRKRLMQIQGGICVYCGAVLSWEGSELDHIVARASGGSNRQSNLVLACLQCNREKGRRPFGRFAAESPRISLEDAIARVRGWQRIEVELTAAAFRNYQNDVIRRLKRVSEDDELDERSMESTAYAARELRERVEAYLASRLAGNLTGASHRVAVYSGRITALARAAGGIESAMTLRGGSSKTRFDRRHHAVDAITLTTLSPSVARVLIHRDDMRSADLLRWHPTRSYKEYKGRVGDQVNYGRWLTAAQELARLGQALIANDGIPVARQLRLRPQQGALHLDTVQKLKAKRLGEAFSDDELRRVVDRRIYEALLEERAVRGAVTEHSDREVRLGARAIVASEEVALFPATAAMLAVQGGAVELKYIHHARIYAWPGRRGSFEYGIIRVFSGEMGRIGLRRAGVDLFAEPLPVWSESYRLAEPRLLERIETGLAKQIGWLAVGDELAFAPAISLPGAGASQKFAALFPDRRWVIDGFPDVSKLRLRPEYLSPEDLPEELDPDVRGLINGQGWRPSVTVALGDSGTRVIRRTVVGRPRWQGAVLPVSWSPAGRAMEMLE